MRPDSRLWLAAGALSAVWIGLAYAVASFAEQLPELDQIYNRSRAFGTLLLPAIVTVVASVWRGRTLKRSLIAFAGSMLIASAILAQHYWDLLRYYTPERLKLARMERGAEILTKRRQDEMFDTAVRTIHSRPPPSSSADQ